MTAGTIMHRSHLPLKTWFMAVHIVTSHSNGISALQLQAQLGLGSYKNAAQAAPCQVPDRSLLEDLIEIDEATVPHRKRPGHRRARSQPTRQDAHCRRGLSPEGEPRRIRLAPIGDFSARSLRAFVAGTSAPGARARWLERLLRPARPRPPAQGRRCNARPSRADVDPSCVLEPEALGARNLPWPGRAHLRRYLDEFVFRWNRRRHTATAFDTLLGIGTRLRPADYRDIVGQRG